MPDDDADASYPACNLSEQLSAYISALAFSPMHHRKAKQSASALF